MATDRVVSDKDIVKIASDYITDWEKLRPFLGLTHAHEEQIRKSYTTYEMQTCEFLKKWKAMKGSKATYDALIYAAIEIGNMQLAEKLKSMEINPSPERPKKSGKVVSFLVH